MSKYNVGFLLEGLSEPEFYVDLVYKFRKIIGKNVFLNISKREMFVIKRLVRTLMFCDRRRAWLLIQSRLTALLTSLIARR